MFNLFRRHALNAIMPIPRVKGSVLGAMPASTRIHPSSTRREGSWIPGMNFPSFDAPSATGEFSGIEAGLGEG